MQVFSHNHSFSAGFVPMIDIGFWTTLARKKLEEFKLDKTAKTVFARYKLNNFADKSGFSHLFFDVYSFSCENSAKASFSGPVEVILAGNLLIFNTIEEFRMFDAETEAKELVAQLKKTQKSFTLAVFADLKSHVFSYRFVSPNIKENVGNIKDFCEISQEFVSFQQFSS